MTQKIFSGHKVYVYVIFRYYIFKIWEIWGNLWESGLADINKFHKRYSVDIKFMFMSYSDIKYYFWRSGGLEIWSPCRGLRSVFGTFWGPGHKLYVYVIFGYYLLILAWPEGSGQPGAGTRESDINIIEKKPL